MIIIESSNANTFICAKCAKIIMCSAHTFFNEKLGNLFFQCYKNHQILPVFSTLKVPFIHVFVKNNGFRYDRKTGRFFNIKKITIHMFFVRKTASLPHRKTNRIFNIKKAMYKHTELKFRIPFLYNPKTCMVFNDKKNTILHLIWLKNPTVSN